mgnify:CR=1 FL=1
MPSIDETLQKGNKSFWMLSLSVESGGLPKSHCQNQYGFRPYVGLVIVLVLAVTFKGYFLLGSLVQIMRICGIITR